MLGIQLASQTGEFRAHDPPTAFRDSRSLSGRGQLGGEFIFVAGMPHPAASALEIGGAFLRSSELSLQIADTGTKRGDLSIAVSELSFQIAHAAAERAVLFPCGGQFVGQSGTIFFEGREIGADIFRCIVGISNGHQTKLPIGDWDYK